MKFRCQVTLNRYAVSSSVCDALALWLNGTSCGRHTNRCVFRQNAFLALCDDRRTPVSSLSWSSSWCTRHKARQQYILRTAWPGITKLYMNFTPVGSMTTPDMTSLSTSGWQLSAFEKRTKMPPQTASGGISREEFKRGSPNFTRLSPTTGPTNLLDMTSLVSFSRLQIAIKYCTIVMRKTGSVGQWVK